LDPGAASSEPIRSSAGNDEIGNLGKSDQERFRNLFMKKEPEILGDEKKVETKKSFISRLADFKAGFIQKDKKIKYFDDEEEKSVVAQPGFFKKFLFIFVIAAMVLSAAVLYFVLPKAEIELVPKSQIVTQELTVIADKGVSKIDSTSNKIPAQLIKLDKKESKEFSTTGERQVNDKAHGVITVYNEYSSSPQGLVEKTRFTSTDGKIFRTTKAVTIPGAKISEGKIVASSIDVEVEADQAGADYNVAAGRFNIPGFQGTPKYSAFYGISKEAMVGGAVGLMKVVSQDDFDKAKDELWQTLEPLLDLKGQVPSGFKMLDGSQKSEMVSVESSVAVGSPAEKFTLTIKGTSAVLIFIEDDIYKLVEEKIAEQVGTDKEFANSEKRVEYQAVEADFSKGQLRVSVKVDEKIVWKFNAEELKKEIAGKNEAQVKEVFGQHLELETVRIMLWPFWVKSVPANLDKIKVSVVAS
jgi:hypothetical protein